MSTTRSIFVSTDLYAAIWRARQSGEETEEEILRRILKVPAAPQPAEASQDSAGKVGFSDYRFGIKLPEGFEIFRTYKGTEYRAVASDGCWKLLSSGATYPSLNQLSRAVSGNVENAWNNWYFMQNGRRRLVNDLRKSPFVSDEPLLQRVMRR